jgi:hypothetical protein
VTGGGSKARGRESLLFVNKKKQKNFIRLDVASERRLAFAARGFHGFAGF